MLKLRRWILRRFCFGVELDTADATVAEFDS